MQRKNASISEKKGLEKKDSERKAPEKLVTVFWFRYNEEADESRKKIYYCSENGYGRSVCRKQKLMQREELYREEVRFK